MLPGKKYTADDYLRMAWRRKWFIIIPALLVSAGTFAWAYFLPDRYRSQTTVLVIPQRVPENYVQSTVTADVSERLQTIQQQILSRTRLERIIEEFNLYQSERKTMIMEDIVARMRLLDIKIAVENPRRRRDDASSFTVSFESSQPRTAMLVAERLASMFVQENLQDRAGLADSTNQFLQAQLEDSRRRLIEHEQKLEGFKLRNAGRLPTQVQSNLTLIQNTQTQINANAEAAARDRDRLSALETAIAEAASTPPPVKAPTRAGDDSNATAAQRLESARASLRALELRLKPEHPDVLRARRTIAELEQKADAEALANPVAPEGAPGTVPGQSVAVAARISNMRVEVQEIRGRLETRKEDDARLRASLSNFSARLEAAPGLEAEQTELMRDYATLQEQYTTLLRKSEESKIAVNLERRQIGEQFKIVDGARLPERPISPDRVRLNLLGLLAGLGLGVALVALLEYRDTTLKTDDDIIISLALPVLAVIPAMVTHAELRRTKRRRIALTLSASLATMLLVVGVVVWRMQLLRDWVR